MRLALVSDIHGNLPALEAIAADIARRGVDRVVNLGDNLSGPLLACETAQYLMASGWLSLAGNHERQLLAVRDGQGGASDVFARAQLGEPELAWLRTLQPSARLDDQVFVCHGTPSSDCEYFLETLDRSIVRLATAAEIEARRGTEDSPVIACGHTHVPRALRTSSGQLLVNPGSVGLQAYSDEHPVPHAVHMGSTDARYAIIERSAAGWQAELRAVPYDHGAMAALAQRNGRPDWAHSLATGYALSAPG